MSRPDLVQSAIIKAAMLAVTVGLVLWIGWPGAWEAEDSGGPGGEGLSVLLSIRIDINRATAAELQALPGIGAVLAERVIRYRDEHGPFRTVEELRNVQGIGPKRLDALRPLITVEDAEAAAPSHGTNGPAN